MEQNPISSIQMLIKKLKQSNDSSEKALGDIFSMINEARGKYTKPIQKASLVIGITDSGKTTLSAFLSGTKLQIEEDKQKTICLSG